MDHGADITYRLFQVDTGDTAIITKYGVQTYRNT